MKEFWDDWYPVIVFIALFAGLLGQFIWKMIYYPEPITLVIIELVFILALVASAILVVIRY